MDLIDRLKQLAARVPSRLDHLATEEATKNALVMPFIQSLGYDVFNPTEIIPEFTADAPTKKGEKVDYAVVRDGKPIILFECKKADTNLDDVHASQLYRYFTMTDARFGILTNGLDYKVYSDLEEKNRMDKRPFLEFRLSEIREGLADDLKRFSKESFDLDNIIDAAKELKYTKGIKRILQEEWVNPSDDFVRIMARGVYSGRMTRTLREQFAQRTKQAFHEFVSDRVNERLKSALDNERASEDTRDTADTDGENESRVEGRMIETTEDEWEGFYVVKSIVRQVVDVRRVFMRDTQNYCGVLFDDNNRTPICRLRFNSANKYLGLFDENKKETRHCIADVNDIYNFADDLKNKAEQYGENGNHTVDNTDTA